MILGSSLVRRYFMVTASVILLFALAIYLYSVPLIKKTVYDIELNASRTALNNVYQVVEKIYLGLEDYRRQALESRKEQLKTVVALASAYVEEMMSQIDRGELTEQEARQQLFEGLRRFTYGNNDYVWIAGYDAKLLSHPDQRFHGGVNDDSSGEVDHTVANIVARARAEGEAFVQYQWQRLNQPEELDKISFVKDFPRWQIVLGSGLYLDDIEAEVQKRLKQSMLELRTVLQQVKIAKTGYMYIFDAQANMLIHPNDNLDGLNFIDQKNPATGDSIAMELIAVADTGQEWSYPWDKPSDPGNYIYQKSSLVRHLKGFDWYIGSSVYEEELQRSSEVLSERIMTITTVVLVLAVFVALVFVSQITLPIRRLADTAKKVSSGDLSAQSGVNSDDELGVLGRTFDVMIRRLSQNIQTLDYQVQLRTQELSATEERQRKILDELPAQIAYLDQCLRYRFVNRRYAQMFSRQPHEVVGRTAREVMGDEMFEQIMPQVELSLQGQACDYEYSFKVEDRQLVTKRKLIPELDADGNVTAILVLSLDITAEKEAERKLTEAQRMSAVGQLAGGLAHDFNNLLTVVIGNLSSAKDRYQQVEGLDRYLEPAIRAGRRGAGITNRLLAFSRNQSLSPEPIDVGAMINESMSLLKGSLPSNIDIQFKQQQEQQQALAYVDLSQLENALFNLALNARDAMPKGGSLIFSICNRNSSAAYGYDEPVAEGDYLEVSVSDTGQGFSEGIEHRAFEPFFTTKSGSNSGLGLSMVYGFVKQSQGYIRIDSQLGQGACVRLLLPVATESLALPKFSDQPLEELQGGGRLVLLAEDNADVRAVIVDQLTAMGFAVVEAADGDEALALLPSLPNLYALVSDIMMPGSLDGYELADRVNQQRPQVRIVLITGYAFDQSDRAANTRGYTLLRKPFQPESLQQALLQSAAASAEQISCAEDAGQDATVDVAEEQ